jgi:hypothetical protein
MDNRLFLTSLTYPIREVTGKEKKLLPGQKLLIQVRAAQL